MGWSNSVYAKSGPRWAMAHIRASRHNIHYWRVLFPRPRPSKSKYWNIPVANITPWYFHLHWLSCDFFHYFIKVSEDEAVDILAREYGVLLMPGSPFGARQFMRLSYGSLPPNAAVSAVERLSEGFQKLRLLSASRWEVSCNYRWYISRRWLTVLHIWMSKTCKLRFDVRSGNYNYNAQDTKCYS